MKAAPRCRSRLLSGTVALAAAAAFMVTGAQPAQADGIGPIIAGVGAISSYVGFATSAYNLFDKYLLGGKPSADLEQLKAAILTSQTAIVAQIDGVASAQVKSCAENAVLNLKNINLMSTDSLQAYATASAACLTQAQAYIGVVSDKAAIDQAGLALNTVGPIALFANAFVGFDTVGLRQVVIAANQNLITRLTPTCTATVDNPDNMPSFGQGPITGHGVCYNYRFTAPPLVKNFTTYIPLAPENLDVAVLPWKIRGLAIPRDDLFPSRGYFVNWPTIPDYSIAASQAMANTSYAVARASLDQLQETYGGAPGSSLSALLTGVNGNDLKVFGVNSSGQTWSNTQTVKRQQAPFGGFSASWSGFDNQLNARSVAVATNLDRRQEVFVTTRTGDIYHRWQWAPGDDNSWSPWAQLPGQLTTISVARNSRGVLELFGVNALGQLYTSWQIRNGDLRPGVGGWDHIPVDVWSSWQSIPGSYAQAAAATNDNGTIELFTLDQAGSIRHARQTGPDAFGSFGGWEGLPGQLTSIAVTAGEFGMLHAFGTNAADQIFHLSQLGQDADNWTGWTQLGGGLRDVTASVDNTGTMNLLGVNAAGNIYWSRDQLFPGEQLGGWIQLTGQLRP